MAAGCSSSEVADADRVYLTDKYKREVGRGGGLDGNGGWE
jgi:hypothetical protein